MKVGTATMNDKCQRPLAFAASHTFWGALGRTIERPAVTIGSILVLIVVLAALLAPWLAPFDPVDQHLVDRLQPPSSTYLLGTDAYGRDILSRLIWGARISLVISLSSVAIAMVVGGTIGMIGGYVGGVVDLVVMRTMDILQSFPTLILGLIVVAVLGANLTNLIIAIALTNVVAFARVARAPTLTVKEMAFVEAGRALGFSPIRILRRHILPNILNDVVAMAGLLTATAVRTEASLAFIGLGIAPPTSTWGGMMRDGFENIFDAPWLSVFAGLAIFILVLALNLIGDGLRDAADVRLRGE